MNIKTALTEIANNTSNNEKIDLLRTAGESFHTLKEILLYTYHPTWNYFIKKFEKPSQTGIMTIENEWYVIRDVLNDLKDRIVTGKRAISCLEEAILLFDADSQDVIRSVVLRDLKCGFSISTINKAFDGLIGTFDVALAVPIKKVRDGHIVLDGEKFYGSRKLDGLRCVCVKNGEHVEFFTRTGKPIYTLDKVKESILHTFSGMNCVIDGEICIVDEHGDEDFRAISSEWNRKNHTIEDPKYLIFDFLRNDIFFKTSEKESPILSERYERVNKIVNDKPHHHIGVLEQVPLDEQAFESMKLESLENGWEGVMLRENIPYKSGRSNSLIKHKLFIENEFEVIDIELGDFTRTVKGVGQRTLEGVVRRLVIEHKGFKVGVGTGLSIQQRIDFAENPSLIVGNEITVAYQETTENNHNGESLRFPSLKAIHKGKRFD